MTDETTLPDNWLAQLRQIAAARPVKNVKLDFVCRNTGDEFHLHVVAPLDQYDTELIFALETAKAWVSRIKVKMEALIAAERGLLESVEAPRA